MWNKYIAILFFASLLFSCKKEYSDYDREDDLVTDTSALLFSAGYISHSTNQLIIGIDMLVFNDLTPEATYSQFLYSGNNVDPNISYDFSNTSVNSLTANNSYSSVFLFNLHNPNWYTQNIVGFYYRRFLEQIETNFSKKTALASIDKNGPNEVVFYKEDKNLYFSNSWQYTMDEFYKFSGANGQNSYQNATQILYLTQRLDETIDSISLSSEVIGDKSITLFSARDFDTGENPTTYLNTTINNANANGIRINLIGPSFNNEVRRLAIETGGFICEINNMFDTGQFDSDAWYSDNLITPIEVYLQNLDRLLTRNVTVHHCNFLVNYSGTLTFQSGDRISLTFNYDGEPINNENSVTNGRDVSIDFIIP